MRKELLAGVDFGTDSVRVLLCNAKNGKEVSHGVSLYHSWGLKKYCNPSKSIYRQHAKDYLHSLTNAFSDALNNAYVNAGLDIVGIAVDTTGSTPCPVDEEGTPLCLLPNFSENPHAMFHLWKDHSSIEEAKEIHERFSTWEIDYTKYQGVYSSEWFWAKILHTIRTDELIKKHAYTWVEHSDWIAGLLIGNTHPAVLYRGSCGAGHKALFNSEFGGLPSRDCLETLDPYLATIFDRYPHVIVPAGTALGKISPTWAEILNVNKDAIIGMGSFDAHAGGVGAGIKLGTMVKVLGTSTVDLVIETRNKVQGKNLKEICGQAEDSIVPGYMGLEMSQPAFGDSYNWIKGIGLWALSQKSLFESVISREEHEKLVSHIEKNFIKDIEAKATSYIYHDELALDWFNGRRYPSLNEHVKSILANLSLSSDLPALYCAVVKGTVFGSRRIFESLLDNGINVDNIIAVGGIAEKSSFVMQMLSDAMKVPIQVSTEKQVCAKGAAIYASVAAGIFKNIPECQQKYCSSFGKTYYPNPEMFALYDKQYQQYLASGELSESLANQRL